MRSLSKMWLQCTIVLMHALLVHGVWVTMLRNKLSAVCAVGMPGHWLFCGTTCCCDIDWQASTQFCWSCWLRGRWTTQFHWFFCVLQADCVLYMQLRCSILVCTILSSCFGKRHRRLIKLTWKSVCFRQSCLYWDINLKFGRCFQLL